MRQEHVLITGGAGFIGSHLAEALVARDYRVTVIDDESTGSTENLATVQGHFHFSYEPGSAANKSLVRRLLNDIDQVYHLAASVGVHFAATAPVHGIETNIYPTELLFSEVLRRSKQGQAIKVFLASSSDVYGKNPHAPWSEDDDMVFGTATRPRWSLGVSKAADEFLAMAYYREHRLPVVIGRLFNIVGPRQQGRFGAVLPRFVEAAVAGRPLVVHEDGHQVRCFAHVSDVVSAMIDLMHTPAAVGGIFNIGGEQPVTIRNLAEQVIAKSKRGSEIVFQTYADAYGPEFEIVPTRIPDLARLHATIDFHPKYDLDSIITEAVSHARDKARRRP